MTTEHQVTRALFATEGAPDTEARLLREPDGGVAFSLRFGAQDVATVQSSLIPVAAQQAVYEALRFVAEAIGKPLPGYQSPFINGWIQMANAVHLNAKAKGFWQDGVERNDGEMISLMHAELSEALEALRDGDPPDKHIPEFNSVETELADLVIRLMDFAHARGHRVAQAIEAKAEYNTTRPHKHGKQF